MSRVDVISYFDSNYADLFPLFAASIAASRAAATQVVLHAFHHGLRPGQLSQLQQLKLPGVVLDLRPFTLNVPKFREYRLPSCVYHRLYLHRLLPKLGRVVYLDVDMIVLADLAPLTEVPLNGSAVAAVVDYILPPPTKAKWHISTDRFSGSFESYLMQFGLEKGEVDQYFNTGLMVMDLRELRRSGIADRLIDEAEASSDKYLFGDQCLINAMLKCRHVELDLAWNVLFAFHADSYTAQPQRAAELTQAKLTAKVAHYAGPKPWTADFKGDGVHFWTFALATGTESYWRARLETAIAGLPAPARAAAMARAEAAIARALPLSRVASDRLNERPRFALGDGLGRIARTLAASLRRRHTR